MLNRLNRQGAVILLGAAGVWFIGSFTGCAQALGIEPWKDPPASTGAGGGSSASATTGAAMTSTSHGSGKGSAVAAGAGGGGGGDATCADKVRNGPETDVDCGGDTCLPCPLGKHCDNDGDCSTNACGDGFCVPSVEHHCTPEAGRETCNDCALNGLETDIDCGGDSCKPCVAGKICLNDADCVSGKCFVAASGPYLCVP